MNIRRLMICIFALFIQYSVRAQLLVEQGESVRQMLHALFGGGVQISNLSTSCDTVFAMGSFDGSRSQAGLQSGVIISTGKVNEASNQQGQKATDVLASSSLNRAGYEPLSQLVNGLPTFDACVIEFDIVPFCDTLSISYVFASEEYLDYVGSAFNDLFAFFISGPGIQGRRNIALVPGTSTPVSINNVNPDANAYWYVDNYTGVTLNYNGFTRPLVAQAAVKPCETYHVVIAIADGSDDILDSAVLLEAGGIGCSTPQLDLRASSSGNSGQPFATEACTNGRFICSLNQPAPENSSFHFRIGGTALPGVDYRPFPDSIFIAKGDSIAIIEVEILADQLLEDTEYIELIYTNQVVCSGVYDADTARLYIHDALNSRLLPDTSMCAGDSMVLGYAPLPGRTYSWSPATGLADPRAARSGLQLENPGPEVLTFSYQLTTSLEDGSCQHTDSVRIQVFPRETFHIPSDTLCQGVPGTFRVSPYSIPLTSWLWDFGDGHKDTLASPLHAYQHPGNYQISLYTRSVYGCPEVSQGVARVEQRPYIDLTDRQICQGDTLWFQPYGAGQHDQWLWAFGDGDTATGPAPAHFYQQPGAYPLRVQLRTPQGCEAVFEREVQVWRPPRAHFTAGQTCQNQQLHIVESSQKGDAQLSSFIWDFGDGNFSTNRQARHTYQHPGTYQIQLSIRDEHGCSDSLKQLQRVYPRPEADFVAAAVCEGQAVEFINLSSGPPATLTYQWNFGDGLYSQQPAPRHIYDTKGQYEVQLVVKNEGNCRDTLLKPLRVYATPMVDFHFSPGCMGDTATFFNQSVVESPFPEDSLMAYSWWFGDGEVSSERHPAHLYHDGEPYQVKLEATSTQGCKGTAEKTYQALPAPPPPQLYGDTVCAGNQAVLNARPELDSQQVYWYDRPAGGNELGQGPAYLTPPLQGGRQYYAEARTPAGCTSRRAAIHALVYPLPSLRIVLSDSLLDLPDAVLQAGISAPQGLSQVRWDFGDGGSSQQLPAVHTYQRPGKYRIRFTAQDEYGCPIQLYRLLEVRKPVQLWIPSAFSPNGDGINDYWFVSHQLIRQLEVRLYNRWGKLVFFSADPGFRWNGKGPDGKDLQEGVYMYVLSTVDTDGLPRQYSGSLTLLR